MHASSGDFLNVAIPAITTAIGVWLLTSFLPQYHFFVVHTTTTKLIYVSLGFVLFMLSFVYRKLIVGVVVIAFFGMLAIIAGTAFLAWLVK